MTMMRWGHVWGFCLLLAGAGAARADVPRRLNHQGRLYDASMKPVSGNQTMRFAIYDAATNGTQLWSESIMIKLEDGYYATTLGNETAPFQAALFDGSTRFLGITIGNDPEMTPREPLESVPYALTCNNSVGDITPHTVSVGGALVIGADGKWVGSPVGLQGPPGKDGTPGLNGTNGRDGANGMMGLPGKDGANGTNGTNGTNGAQGSPGVPCVGCVNNASLGGGVVSRDKIAGNALGHGHVLVSRFHSVKSQQDLASGQTGSFDLFCNSDEALTGAFCPALGNIVNNGYFLGANGWHCEYYNPTPNSTVMFVNLICSKILPVTLP